MFDYVRNDEGREKLARKNAVYHIRLTAAKALFWAAAGVALLVFVIKL